MSAVRDAVETTTRPAAAAREVPAGRRPGWWGMVLTLATDLAAFAALLAGYFYIRFVTAQAWPPDGIAEPKLLKPWIMTALLMASSIPAYLADSSIRRGEVDRLRLYLASTLLLGAAFLALQAWEYSDKLDVLRPQDDAYGSLFYTITGLHGSHVIVGLLLLLWTQFFAWRGAYTAERHVAVQVAALYWHFVHVVWLFVFVSLCVGLRALISLLRRPRSFGFFVTRGLLRRRCGLFGLRFRSCSRFRRRRRCVCGWTTDRCRTLRRDLRRGLVVLLQGEETERTTDQH